MAKEIVSISLGTSDRDSKLKTRLFDEEFHIRRFGTDGDVERARQLIAGLAGQVDAISLEEMRFRFTVGSHRFTHQEIQNLAQTAQSTPVLDGSYLKNTLERWTISRIARQQPDLFAHRRIFVLSGVHDDAMTQVLSRFTAHILFGDPIFHLGLPFALRSYSQLNKYADWIMPRLCRTPYRKMYPTGPDQERHTPRAIKHFKRANVIVGDIAYLRRFAPRELEGKIIVTNFLSPDDLRDLESRGAQTAITTAPLLGSNAHTVGLATIEAMLTTLIDKPDTKLTADDFLELIADWEFEPQAITLNQPPDVARFAFVIHPLTTEHIFNHPLLKYLRIMPRALVERAIANIPPLHVSRMKGIRSTATQKEVEGVLITLGATPREFLRRKPGFTYRRLIVASRMAQQMGAKIMGLGAFTKVVGDAGITVGQKADIAITSGNSLTVAATLEAAKQAVIKMGATDLTKGRAVVIGATGSIGAVCARLLAQAIQDVVLVAPRPERLIQLKKTIEDETPGACVVIATDAGPHLPTADLVVTTTTAIGQKVIDVLQLKPGCVVCDVARPPDVTEDDAKLRPDVLIIESGEVLLPGEPDFGFNIGLPPGVAYACLAEAALLSMEGRFENFTLGRNIEMERVKEIYRLFKKHGLELEGLRSFGRYVNDEDVARKRELADAYRRHPEKLEALIAEARATGDPRQLRPIAPARDGRLKQIGASLAAGAVAVGWLLRRRKRES